MASSVNTTKTIFTTVTVLFLTSTTKAQLKCDYNAGNYTTNSTFSTNLQSLLRALTLNATNTGLSDGRHGSIPDRVYGLVLCRGDVDSATCLSCLSTVSQDVVDQCPSKKGAAIWFDYCFLRYSNTRFAGEVDEDCIAEEGAIVASNLPRLKKSVVTLLGRLRRYAAYNTSAPPPPMFATGLIEFNREYPYITALVQCTRDLTPDQCNQCLTHIIGSFDNQSISLKYVAMSCNFRYEVRDVYDQTARISLPAIAADP